MFNIWQGMDVLLLMVRILNVKAMQYWCLLIASITPCNQIFISSLYCLDSIPTESNREGWWQFLVWRIETPKTGEYGGGWHRTLTWYPMTREKEKAATEKVVMSYRKGNNEDNYTVQRSRGRKKPEIGAEKQQSRHYYGRRIQIIYECW